MRAGLLEEEETLLKRKVTSERFWSFGRTRRGLSDLYIPSLPYPDLCIDNDQRQGGNDLMMMISCLLHV